MIDQHLAGKIGATIEDIEKIMVELAHRKALNAAEQNDLFATIRLLRREKQRLGARPLTINDNTGVA